MHSGTWYPSGPGQWYVKVSEYVPPMSLQPSYTAVSQTLPHWMQET
ncbi:hypothetical protein PV733_28250 [Streptomyces europaeiscabiei]|nr:hypothetical protein [Streptomyces europaeiscabiei]MDX3712763.1 hypothetical protein [Streptomyces europaeiscabiei]